MVLFHLWQEAYLTARAEIAQRLDEAIDGQLVKGFHSNSAK